MNGFIVILAIAYFTMKGFEAVTNRHAVRKNENTEISSMEMGI